MKSNNKISVFWFRRDLRLSDNVGLQKALQAGLPVLPIFIFDSNILEELPRNDSRVTFIHKTLQSINEKLRKQGSSILCLHGKPEQVWQKLVLEYEIVNVFTNKDYEPYAIERDLKVGSILKKYNINFQSFKDQVIFEENEILKADNSPYTVYTPYKRKWLEKFKLNKVLLNPKIENKNFLKIKFPCLTLEQIGFQKSDIKVLPYNLNIKNYAETRDFPALDSTSYLSVHLRFGTVSIREIVSQLGKDDDVFLSELIWREFFMQILFHFPQVVNQSFKAKYEKIKWRNNEKEFELWCSGKTGYPLVDAGMRQLNETGYMHNRVRMVVASFLTKHLLIDWRLGEAYFAKKLLDFELSANNGNWQWAAGTGCDATPYFRIFNPTEQIKKFDKNLKYVKKWLPDFNSLSYPQPIVEHKLARQRALNTYKQALQVG